MVGKKMKQFELIYEKLLQLLNDMRSIPKQNPLPFDETIEQIEAKGENK
jgi:hypothetical protein